MGLLDELDARRERTQQDHENSSRLAQSYAEITTEGAGTTHIEKRIDFGLTFIEKPAVTYACEIDLDKLADAEDIADSGDVELPTCTGFVIDWDRDERDFYLGAWVSITVYFPSSISGSGATLPAGVPEIIHHFTFAAVAMKDLPVDNTDSIN
jgi:hypothetical protein